MKKVIIGLLIVSAILCGRYTQAMIIDYGESDRNAVMEIAFQDPLDFFVGSIAVKSGYLPVELFEAESKKTMEGLLNNPLYIKRVLVANSVVAGFAEFCKIRETSLESLRCTVEAQGMSFNENLMLTLMPYLKRTDAECKEYAQIGSIAVSRNYRGKGYGKSLLKDAAQTIKKLWPHFESVQLDVNDHNEIARKLYLSEGFQKAKVQPAHLGNMKATCYEKALQ